MSGIVIIVQARMESSRFPRKIIEPIMRQPMILHQLDRLRRVEAPHRLIVATTNTMENKDIFGHILTRHGYEWMAPDVPEDDVLARYARIAQCTDAGVIVRITGDCPLIDPRVVDAAIARYMAKSETKYVALAKQWPDGLDVEIIDNSLLYATNDNAKLASDREHVTPWIWRGCYIQHDLVPCPFDLSDHCWSVDTRDDFNKIREIIVAMYQQKGPYFGWRDVFGFLAQYRLHKWATSRNRNESYMQQIGGHAEGWNDLRYLENM